MSQVTNEEMLLLHVHVNCINYDMDGGPDFHWCIDVMVRLDICPDRCRRRQSYRR